MNRQYLVKDPLGEVQRLMDAIVSIDDESRGFSRTLPAIIDVWTRNYLASASAQKPIGNRKADEVST